LKKWAIAAVRGKLRNWADSTWIIELWRYGVFYIWNESLGKALTQAPTSSSSALEILKHKHFLDWVIH